MSLFAEDSQMILFEDEYAKMSSDWGSYTKDVSDTRLYDLYCYLLEATTNKEIAANTRTNQPTSTSGWEILIVSDALCNWIYRNQPGKIANEVNCQKQSDVYEILNYYVLRAIRLPKGFKVLTGTVFEPLQDLLKKNNLAPIL